ncbi:hypothetical protein HUT06_06100 [Actinomadura sp. NAK00032]|uniref:GIDE domain-containing protein n=1 Tax=Actinomadura sp. NAK00032 TaxID=2742128 RepID=UPI001590D964|nr:GIDE domain-containing protein [Actinomadura sp. NAK00032]QKW33657.1 hypothetical protein HUT06_06100 [Actinomadura sp. NAK00032]
MSNITGALLVPLLIAAALLAAGWVWRIRYRNLRRAAVASCAEAAALPAGVPCQVSGTAVAVQAAPFSGRPCAWYMAKATAKTGTGKTVFIDKKSETPFHLEDKTGRLAIDPATAAVDGAVRSMDERRPDSGQLPGLDGEVAEYHYEEWILPAHQPLYVLGTSTGTGTIGKDKETGQYAVSTRTREEYRRRAVLFMGIGYGGGAAIFAACAAVVGVFHVMD